VSIAVSIGLGCAIAIGHLVTRHCWSRNGAGDALLFNRNTLQLYNRLRRASSGYANLTFTLCELCQNRLSTRIKASLEMCNWNFLCNLVTFHKCCFIWPYVVLYVYFMRYFFLAFAACSTADCKMNVADWWTRVYKLEARRSSRRSASGKDSVSQSRGSRSTICSAEPLPALIVQHSIQNRLARMGVAYCCTAGIVAPN